MGVGWKVVGGIVAAGGIAIFGGTLATEDDTTRDESGAITGGGGLGAFVVRVGDCVNAPEEDEVASFEGVPCENAHDAEAYAKFDLTTFESFDAKDVALEAEQGCVERWPDAIGTTYEDDTELDVYTLIPSVASWKGGDREVVCFVVSIDGSSSTGSRLRR